MTKTNAYPAVNVLICPTKLAKVPDIATGTKRSRKYAIIMSLSGIPNLHEQPEPIMVSAELQNIIIDGDNFEDLRERCIMEIDGIIAQMKEILTPIPNEESTQKTP